VQWCRLTDESFHARNAARGRRYVYLLLESPVRPAVEAGSVGWSFRALDGASMQSAARQLLGEHDFSAFRSSGVPGADAGQDHPFDRDFTTRGLLAFRVRCERVPASHGAQPDGRAARDRRRLCATKPGSLPCSRPGIAAWRRRPSRPTGLYFVGPYYDPVHAIPHRTAAFDWLP
jgi:tRNA pseudouridine38-40 synthase